MKILVIGGNGYIGTRLGNYFYKERNKYMIGSLDLNVFYPEIPARPPSSGYSCNYVSTFKNTGEEFLSMWDVIIHLAGHSSVPACELDPFGSIKNNCIDFFHIVEKLNKNQKLIYASSGSVYGSVGDHLSKETDKLQEPIQEYDKQKQLLDYYMESSDKTFYGLRFGTVCGYSGNARNELMINAMVRSAKKTGWVKTTSSNSYRAVLGLNDLCRAVVAIIEGEGEPGFYNLASFNKKIGHIGDEVWKELNCNREGLLAGSNNYSFCLDTSKFEQSFKFEFQDTCASIVKEALNNDFSLERKWEKLKACQTA